MLPCLESFEARVQGLARTLAFGTVVDSRREFRVTRLVLGLGLVVVALVAGAVLGLRRWVVARWRDVSRVVGSVGSDGVVGPVGLVSAVGVCGGGWWGLWLGGWRQGWWGRRR